MIPIKVWMILIAMGVSIYGFIKIPLMPAILYTLLIWFITISSMIGYDKIGQENGRGE